MLKVTVYGLVDWSSSPDRDVFFSLSLLILTCSGAHRVDTGSLSLGLKRPGRKADHCRPCSAEVKKGWRYTSTTSDVLITYA
jgi:hypothetical protein